MSTLAVQIVGSSFRYPSPLPGGSPITALAGIDLEVAGGEFVAVMGRVGAGKSTLCLTLNGAIPQVIDGDFDGCVLINGQDTQTAPMGQLALQAGLLLENVPVQLFNASVADEVAFGLETMGLPVDEIEQRSAQVLSLVGLTGFERRIPQTLSGGEQKRLALASVLAMRPSLLILDEPTSGLDPRGRRQVLDIIQSLRREYELAVVMATQDAEAVARFADRVVILEKGFIVFSGPPTDLFSQVERVTAWGLAVPQLALLAHLMTKRTGHSFPFGHPEQMRQALATAFAPGLGVLPSAARCTSSDGVGALGRDYPQDKSRIELSSLETPGSAVKELRGGEPIILVDHLSYRYPTADRLALQDMSLCAWRSEWLAVIGVNGSGKSTLIKHLNGLLKPMQGVVRIDGQDTRSCQIGQLARTVSYLPQDPDRLIFCATVREEIAYGPKQLGLHGQALDSCVADTLGELDLNGFADHAPAVLSYGLRRQVALASVLAMNAPVLALDEPTAGLDQGSIDPLLGVIERRHRQGTTIVTITHDLRLAARYADRVAVLYQGRLVALGAAQDVLADIELLTSVGLDPLPVTLFSADMHMPPPLPLTAQAFADRLGCPGDDDE